MDTEIGFKNVDPDVTGGMKRKLDLMFEIASMDCEVGMVNGLVPGRLKNAITGEGFYGTKVEVR